MTTKQKRLQTERKLIEHRRRLNELALKPEPTAEERTERDRLLTECRDLDAKLLECMDAEAEEAEASEHREELDAEEVERRQLRSRASLGRYLASALRGVEPSGAEAEFRDACKVAGIPTDLWERDRPRVEHRADAATPIPASGTGVTVAPIQPFIFAPSIAPMLGIEMPGVGSGAYSEMRISTALTAAPVALTAVTANPRSIRGRLTLAVEDVAQVGTESFEASLRQNLSSVMSDALDNQVLNGDGSSSNISGLIAQLADPTNPTDVADFDAFVALFADHIDGLWASRLRDVAAVVNVDAYRLSATTFRDRSIDVSTPADEVRAAVSLGDTSFADYAAEKTGGWWTNKRMPATASTIARCVVHRKGRGLRTACLPQWGSLSIDDIYTSAARGERHFTVNMLVGDKVLLVQPDAYALAELKVS